MMNRLKYLRRVFSAYLLPGSSQLSFWHDTPRVGLDSARDRLGEYYMAFTSKADYSGGYDSQGIPQLNYRGSLGFQYNPIAIAQYGLGNHTLYLQQRDPSRRQKFLTAADWLESHLEPNSAGCDVWHHHFDWEYRDVLKAPWYSGLAQGQGISLLVRAYQETGLDRYLAAARRAFVVFTRTIENGGVIFRDDKKRPWIEEYIVFPPTHILNGFIWASWGVYDFHLVTGDGSARSLWEELVKTLHDVLPTYDTRYWSLYEHSGTRMKMLASPFYHSLHIVQLQVMYRLTGDPLFEETQKRWNGYRSSPVNRGRAWVHKAMFKLMYY